MRAGVSIRNISDAVCDVLRSTISSSGIIVRFADRANVRVCEESLAVGNGGVYACIVSQLETLSASQTNVLIQEISNTVWNVLWCATLSSSQIVTVGACPTAGGVKEQTVVVSGDWNTDSVVWNESNNTITANVSVGDINVAKWHVLRVTNAEELVEAGSA